jgi:hypothetical protein
MGPIQGKDKMLISLYNVFSDKELMDIDIGKLHEALNKTYEAGKQGGYREGTEDTIGDDLA